MKKKILLISFTIFILFSLYGKIIAGSCIADTSVYVSAFEDCADEVENADEYYADCLYREGIMYLTMGNNWAKEENKEIFESWAKSSYRDRITNAAKKILKNRSNKFYNFCLQVLAKFRIQKVENYNTYDLIIDNSKSIPKINPLDAAMLGDKRATRELINSFYSEEIPYTINGNEEVVGLPIGYFDHIQGRISILSALWFLNDTNSIKFLKYVIDNDPSSEVRSLAGKVLMHINTLNDDYVYSEEGQILKESTRLIEYEQVEYNIDIKELVKLLNSTDKYIVLLAARALINLGDRALVSIYKLIDISIDEHDVYIRDRVRVRLIGLLASSKKTLEEIKKLSNDEKGDKRLKARILLFNYFVFNNSSVSEITTAYNKVLELQEVNDSKVALLLGIISKFKNQETKMEFIEELITSKNPISRRIGLTASGDQFNIYKLAKFLDDNDENVRQSAFNAMEFKIYKDLQRCDDNEKPENLSCKELDVMLEKVFKLFGFTKDINNQNLLIDSYEDWARYSYKAKKLLTDLTVLNGCKNLVLVKASLMASPYNVKVAEMILNTLKGKANDLSEGNKKELRYYLSLINFKPVKYGGAGSKESLKALEDKYKQELDKALLTVPPTLKAEIDQYFLQLLDNDNSDEVIQAVKYFDYNRDKYMIYLRKVVELAKSDNKEVQKSAKQVIEDTDKYIQYLKESEKTKK